MDTPSLFDDAVSASRNKENTGGGPITEAHLSSLHEQGGIAHVDYYLARAVGRAFPGVSPLCQVSCALVSNALSKGHICLDLREMAGETIFSESGADPLICLPDLDTWVRALAASGCVGDEAKEGRGRDWILKTPLILDRDLHLYLSKYFDFQQRLIRNIAARAASGRTGPSPAFIETGLDRLFAGQDPERTAGQRLAVKKALEGNFLVISGGPGTGKTHVTSIISSLLEEWHREEGLPEPRIIAMAPTGKAAARLISGRTIHSVLRPRPRGVGFVHGTCNPLHADLVIVDEASMIDMALMARLMEAVSPDTRLILLGDKNQLSPVQAGAVFTDLCSVPELERAQAFLTVNFRSAGKSGIDLLSRAVNENDTPSLVRVLESRSYPDIQFENTGNNSPVSGIIEEYLGRGYRAVCDAPTPEDALDALDGFRVLCAHNRGDAGTLQVNHLCEKLLRSPGTDGITRPFFKQIVMVTQNDYGRGLFNGDTGVVFDMGKGPRAYFRDDGTIRKCRMTQVPAHEAAFAVTIHKSQGSEFDTVLILIPDRLSPVITRQLLYTGITRARSKVIIAGSLDLICQAVNLAPKQRSNLAKGLTRCLEPEPL